LRCASLEEVVKVTKSNNKNIILKMGEYSGKGMERPSLFWLVTEAGRAITELGVTYSYQKLQKNKRSGDGHPVLVLPGFMASEKSTTILRNFIDEIGYVSHDWGLGRNRGKVNYLDILVEKTEQLHRHHRGQKVSLVGWSLGGVFARQVAKARPDLVRQVITLGSPFGDIARPNNVAWLHTLISGGKTAKDVDKNLLENLPVPAPVPTTAIYTKEDGIVPWKVCMEQEVDAFHQNIQVRGSHCGLGVNTSVLSIIEDRLRLTADNWQHFKPKNSIDSMLFYPSL
jgi:pimeloyl-ACP methyl ester carboxylesterase